MNDKLNYIYEKLGTLEEGQKGIKSDIEYIKTKIEKRNPSKYLEIIILILLIGVFSWLGVLTNAIIRG